MSTASAPDCLPTSPCAESAQGREGASVVWLELNAVGAHRAHLKTCAASCAGRWIDAGTIACVQQDCIFYGAGVNTHTTSFALPGEAAAFMHMHLRHDYGKLTSQHAWLAGADAGEISAHDARLNVRADHGRAGTMFAVCGIGHHDRLGRTGLAAVTTSCARAEELAFRHGARWPLQHGQSQVRARRWPIFRPPPPAAAKQISPADAHVIDGISPRSGPPEGVQCRFRPLRRALCIDTGLMHGTLGVWNPGEGCADVHRRGDRDVDDCMWGWPA